MIITEDAFCPVKGSESNIQSKPIKNGHIYFATDSGHIYMDDNNKRVLVGGGQGATIYYSFSTSIKQNELNYWVINNSDLEDPTVKYIIGDIIINSDGSFYKITELPSDLSDEIWCDRIAVSGSGDGPSLVKKIAVKLDSPETTNLINGQEFSISLVATSAIDGNGVVQDDKLQVTWSLNEKNANGQFVKYHEKTIDVNSGEKVEIEIGSLMRENSTVKLMVYAYGINSGQSTIKSIDFTTANLELRPAESFSNLYLFDSNQVIIQCNAIGNTEKLLYYYWDGKLLDNMPVALAADSKIAQSKEVPSSLATHGRHSVRIELYQNVNGKNGLKAGELEFELGVKGSSNKPIIWTNGYKKKYYDYEIIQIPFQVYDPQSATASVHLYHQRKEIDGSPWNITYESVNPKFTIWEITNASIGVINNSYSIVCGEDDRQERYDLSFEVEATDKLKLVTDNLILNFDATGRSNRESATNRERWSNPIANYERYIGHFKDFNWYNNGWITGDDNKTFLRVSNGAKFSINFDPMVFSSGIESSNSWTVEMQFKVSNLKNYQSLITTYTRYPNDADYWKAFREQITAPNGYTNYDAYLRSILGEKTDTFCETIDHIEKMINTEAAICKFYDTNGLGFCLGPQDAFFTTKQDTVNVNYVEDKIINIAIVFSHSNQFISIYLNGVLSGIAKSSIGGTFTINSDLIEFNSEYCDINLYKFRVYNTNLAINYVDLNLAADRKDIDLYDQTNLALYNSALNEYQFNYDNMIDYNKNHPDDAIMPYVIWTTHGKTDDDNKLPYSKANVINTSMEFHNVALDRAYVTGQLNDLAAKDGLTDEECLKEYGMTAVQYYYLHHCPSWHGDNIEMKVQGTSSEFYPRRNYKCKTKTKGADGKKNVNMYMNSGPFEGTDTQTDWFYYDNYTVGTSKFTMKIDFMESSGSYNVGFANLVNNAYSKHPLDDYNKKGAFQVLDSNSTVEKETTEYAEGVSYWYYNHKGNPKMANSTNPDDADNIKITSKENFDLGPYALYEKLMKEDPSTYTKLKVAGSSSDKYNKWYIMEIGYKKYEVPNTQNYRTSVQGFPVLAFHKREDTGEIKYIGRYNMITDKGSDEVYGFAIDGVYQKFADNREVSKVAECWEFSDNIGTFCSYRDPNGREKLEFNVLKEDGTQNLTENGAPIVANSFEYRYHNASDDIDIVYELNQADTEKLNTLAKDQNLTDLSPSNREPARKWLLDIMKNWEKACAWIWSTCTDVVPTEAEIKQAIDSNDWSSIENKYQTTQDKIIFETGITYNSKEYLYDSQEYRLAKFQVELPKHFDIDYTTTYFVMTEVFECYDSRGKNCMMASWGPLEEKGEYIWYPIFYDIDTQLGINNTGIPSFTFDIDATQDGCFSTNNSVLWTNFYKCFKNSYIRQKYRQLRGYTDDSINKDNFGELTMGPLQTVDRIERWYLADADECGRGLNRNFNDKHPFLAMKGQRPLIALNLDEYYKYITITNNNISAGGGYLGQNGEWISDNSNGKPIGSFFYALQGDRSLSRQQFLTDRLNYIDSWLKCGEFQRGEGSGQVWGRISANIPSEFPDLWITQASSNLQGEKLTVDPEYWLEDGITKKHEFDAEYWVTLTPARSTYLTIGLDNSAIGGDSAAEGSDATEDVSLKYKGSPVKIEFPVDISKAIRTDPKKHQQLLYLYAASQMTDLGDMSKLYWSEFHMTNDCKKLTRLLLGNDNFDCLDGEGAKRGYYRLGTQPLALKSMPLLQEMCLSGIRSTNANGISYDLSYSEKLKSFRALRTDITNMTFAEGVALDTLYLPESINSLELTEARQLTNILKSYPVTRKEGKDREYNCEKGLYIEKLFDENPMTNINRIKLIGDKMGYDSYTLISQVSGCKTGDLALTITGIDWCPYKLIDEGTVYNIDEKDLYYKDNKHYGFEPYEYKDEAKWNLNVLNGELYKLDNDLLINRVNEIDFKLLEKFVENNTFKSATEASLIPTLSGIIFINNDTEIDEGDIRNKWQEYYPNVKFFFKTVKKAYSAEFKMAEEDGTYKVLNTQKITANNIDNQWFKNPYTEYNNPTKLDYDFLGWATDASGKGTMIGTLNSETDQYEISDEDWNALRSTIYEEGKYDYEFFAIFDVQSCRIEFYDESNLKEPMFGVKGKYGETVYEVVSRTEYTTNLYFNYKEIDGLNNDERYAFKGWVKDSEINTSNIIDPKQFKLTSNLKLVAHYEKENCALVPSNPEYFNINNKTISLKEEYKYVLQGKITLPLYNGNTQLTTIGDFSAKSSGKEIKITDIYFLSGNSGYTTIRDDAFNAYGGSSLISNIDFPGTITKIGNNAFDHSANLINVGSLCGENCSLEEIGRAAFTYASKINLNLDNAKNLKTLGGSSEFNKAGSGVVLKNGLPKTITSIGPFCFSGCPNVVIQDFSNIKSIGSVGSTYTCLDGAGTGSGLINIILPDDLSGYAQNCFKNYARNCIRNITYANSSPVDDEQLAYLGLTKSNPQSIDYVIE